MVSSDSGKEGPTCAPTGRNGREGSADTLSGQTSGGSARSGSNLHRPITRRAFFTDPAALAIFQAARSGTLDMSCLPSYLRPKPVRKQGQVHAAPMAAAAPTPQQPSVASSPAAATTEMPSEPAVAEAVPYSPKAPILVTATAAAQQPALAVPPSAIDHNAGTASAALPSTTLPYQAAVLPPPAPQPLATTQDPAVVSTAPAAPQPTPAALHVPTHSIAASGSAAQPAKGLPYLHVVDAAAAVLQRPLSPAPQPDIHAPPVLTTAPAPQPAETMWNPQASGPAISQPPVTARFPLPPPPAMLPVIQGPFPQRIIALQPAGPIAPLQIAVPAAVAAGPQPTPPLPATLPPMLVLPAVEQPLAAPVLSPPVPLPQPGANPTAGAVSQRAAAAGEAPPPPLPAAAPSSAGAAAAALEACLQPCRSVGQPHKELRVRAVLALAMSQAWDECVRQHCQGKGPAQAGSSQKALVAGSVSGHGDGFQPTRQQLAQLGWTTERLDQMYQRFFPPYPAGRMSSSCTAIMYESLGKGIATRTLRTWPGTMSSMVVLAPSVEWGSSRAAEMQRLLEELSPQEAAAKQRHEAQEQAGRERAARQQALAPARSGTPSPPAPSAAGGPREVAQAVALPWHLKEVIARIRIYLRMVLAPQLTSKDPKPLPLEEALRGLRITARVTLDEETLGALRADSAEALLASLTDVVELRCGDGGDGVHLVPSAAYRSSQSTSTNQGLHWRCSGGSGAAPLGLRPLPLQSRLASSQPPRPQSQPQPLRAEQPSVTGARPRSIAAHGAAAPVAVQLPGGRCDPAAAGQHGGGSPVEPRCKASLSSRPRVKKKPNHVLHRPPNWKVRALEPPEKDEQQQQEHQERAQKRQRSNVVFSSGKAFTHVPFSPSEPGHEPGAGDSAGGDWLLPSVFPQGGSGLPLPSIFPVVKGLPYQLSGDGRTGEQRPSDTTGAASCSTVPLTAPAAPADAAAAAADSLTFTAGNSNSCYLSGASCQGSAEDGGGGGCSLGLSAGPGRSRADLLQSTASERYQHQELPAHLRPKGSAHASGSTRAPPPAQPPPPRPPQPPSEQQPQPQPQAQAMSPKFTGGTVAKSTAAVGAAALAAGAAIARGSGSRGEGVPSSREWHRAGEMPVRIDQWRLPQAEALGADCLAACRAAGSSTAWLVTGYREDQVLASRWGPTRLAALQALRQVVLDMYSRSST